MGDASRHRHVGVLGRHDLERALHLAIAVWCHQSGSGVPSYDRWPHLLRSGSLVSRTTLAHLPDAYAHFHQVARLRGPICSSGLQCFRSDLDVASGLRKCHQLRLGRGPYRHHARSAGVRSSAYRRHSLSRQESTHARGCRSRRRGSEARERGRGGDPGDGSRRLSTGVRLPGP